MRWCWWEILFLKKYVDWPSYSEIVLSNKDKCFQRINDQFINKTKHNKNWPYIPDRPYRILIIGGSGSGKTNALFV